MSDNGSGIDARTLPGVFEPFVRGSDTADQDDVGTGPRTAPWFASSSKPTAGGSPRRAPAGRGSEFLVTLPLAEPLAPVQ